MSRIEVRHTGTERGRGVFATAPILTGETIESAPVLIFSRAESAALRQTLLYHYMFEWGKQGQTALVLGWGSLYNHSDSPNARHVFDFQTEQMRFIALKPIFKDQEIFINYLNDYDRKAKNRELWFEPCTDKLVT